MSHLQNSPKLLIGVILLIIIIIALIAGWTYRSKIRAVLSWGKTIAASGSIENKGNFSNILFLHQSTGRNLIAKGNIRGQFTEAGYDFWDHDYNHIGLKGPDGVLTGYSYNIPQDNTTPRGYAALFNQSLHNLPTNAFSAVMQHEVIIFKSCFPVSNISSPEQLENYKRFYLSIAEVAAQHPDHIFIALSPPPLTPKRTNPANAANARAFADWLQSDEFLDGRPNLHSFNFFSHLAEGDPTAPDYNMLRADYRRDNDEDSHPNKLANETVGPQLVEFVIETIASYREATK